MVPLADELSLPCTQREQLSSAKAVYKLYEEKLDLLQSENLPSVKPASGAADATAKALAELKSVVDNHHKVRRIMEGLVALFA